MLSIETIGLEKTLLGVCAAVCSTSCGAQGDAEIAIGLSQKAPCRMDREVVDSAQLEVRISLQENPSLLTAPFEETGPRVASFATDSIACEMRALRQWSGGDVE